jgi:DivIVA domain-containing protein
MATLVLYLIAALVVGAIVFGVAVLITGDDQGIEGDEPDGRAIPLPSARPLGEGDLSALRFDTVVRGYRMSQVDAALRRAAYDIGYKQELIQVLEAEVAALREGRTDDADQLRSAREAAVGGAVNDAAQPAGPVVDLDQPHAGLPAEPPAEPVIDLDEPEQTVLDRADAEIAAEAPEDDEVGSAATKPSSTVSQ